MKKIVNEFKEFISKGNVLDLAVGVIIGAAFQKIVTSLVNDILMPIIGMIIGGHDFTDLTLKFKDATINYGIFIQNIIDFLLMALCIFLIVKVFNTIKDNAEKKIKKQEEKEKVTEVVKSNEEVPLFFKDIKKNEKNMFVCDFANKDYFWLEELV